MAIIEGLIVLQIDKDYDVKCHAYTMYGRNMSCMKSYKTIFRWWSSSKKFKYGNMFIEASNCFKQPEYLIRTIKLPTEMVSKITGKNLLASFNNILNYFISCVTTESQREIFHNIGCGFHRNYNVNISNFNLALLDNIL